MSERSEVYWVPAYVPWRLDRCAVFGCTSMRKYDHMADVVRRWCERHCNARLDEIAAQGGGRVIDLFR